VDAIAGDSDDRFQEWNALVVTTEAEATITLTLAFRHAFGAKLRNEASCRLLRALNVETEGNGRCDVDPYTENREGDGQAAQQR
jgi:hypothetical protein